MRRFTLVATLAVAGGIFAAGGQVASAQAPTNTNPNQQPEKVMVTVRPGDSLSKIGAEHNTPYKRIYDANEVVTNPDIIHPGQELRIPRPDEVLPDRSLPTAAPAAQPARRASAPAGGRNFASGNSVWDRLAACESGGNWSINTGNGYYGGLQFSLSSWRSVGGSGYPHQASREEQIARGERLRASGGWGHWPACSAKLGLR